MLLEEIKDFIHTQDDSIIMFEGLEYLTVHNDFSRVLKFIHALEDEIALHRSRLILAINPKVLGEKDRALLEIHPERVPSTRPVRQLRAGSGAHRLLDKILQLQAPPPGDRGLMPGRPLLRDPARAQENPGAGDRGEHAGAGPARASGGSVLYGGAHGRPVGGDPCREG